MLVDSMSENKPFIQKKWLHNSLFIMLSTLLHAQTALQLSKIWLDSASTVGARGRWMRDNLESSLFSQGIREDSRTRIESSDPQLSLEFKESFIFCVVYIIDELGY